MTMTEEQVAGAVRVAASLSRVLPHRLPATAGQLAAGLHVPLWLVQLALAAAVEAGRVGPEPDARGRWEAIR